MSFNPNTIQLPVKEIISDARGMLSNVNTLIVAAPPGAGKSTLLPLAFLDQPWLLGKKILMLEPRRLAARTIAQRMADLLEEEVGDTVGYRIRFESRVTKNTKIEVLTEGILTRMLQQDNALEQAGLVIFDEFHERSLHADLALALCREAQQVLRPELRILVVSATLNLPELSALLQAPVIESKGRQYPVEIFYGSDADETLLPELAAQTVSRAVKEHEGDVLVFLPGEGEIRRCEEMLHNAFSEYSIHALYGQLPASEQYRAIMPDRHGRRKIVLATSIAETSLTIEGIRIVVDSGFGRSSRFDPGSGLSKLVTTRVSKDSADQRAGRAGRLSSGRCYRMWSNATHERLADHRIPEILEADLAPLVLDLAQWGVSDIQQLTWLDPPPPAHLAQAAEILEQLSAIENGKITRHGKEMQRLPCHPRIAHMLLIAKDLPAKQLACDIAALLEERDPLPRDSGIDLNLRIEALRRARSGKTMNRIMQRIEKAAAAYRRLLDVSENNSAVDVWETGLLLASAYPERIASARPGNNAQFQLANGRIAAAGHKDDLAHEAWLAVAHMDMREGLGKIYLASPLNPKDLLEIVKEREVISWESRKGGLVAAREMRIGSIVLQSKPLAQVSDEAVAAAVSEAVKKEGLSILSFDEKMTQLQNRILSLRKWAPELGFPDVSTVALLENSDWWLAPYIKGLKRNEELKRLDLAGCLYNSLEFTLQQKLDALAPSRIEVPSGSRINLEYFPNGASPVLAVRLQEVFGMSDTPSVHGGKNKVVMHLLSPGFKPVQVTSDLKSFWNNLYHEVKRELQRRYPKHAWPEDPWQAPPVAKGRHQEKK